jgi:hypothetical protein
MGLQDFMSEFSNLDPSCKGFVTTDQLLEFYQSIYFTLYIKQQSININIVDALGQSDKF